MLPRDVNWEGCRDASGFRRPAADFRVELSENTLRPGDEMNVRVSLVPRDGFEVRRGAVVIECIESYVELSPSMNTGRYGTGRQRLKGSRILYRHEEVIIEDGRMRRGLPFYCDFEWVVPSDALPTVIGESRDVFDIGIAWTVTTSFDVAGARDFNDRQQIAIGSPLADTDEASRTLVREFTDDEVALTLTLGRSGYVSWETIEGTLRAEVLQDLDVTEVRAELVRIESFGYDGDDFLVGRVRLEGEADLPQGGTREWHFRLETGEVYAPTLRTDYSSIRWLVRCVLARRMRLDTRIEQEVRVVV